MLNSFQLGEPELGMHTCPHPASKICQNLNWLFLKVVFCAQVGFKKYNLAMVSYFNKHSLPGNC